MHANQPCHTLQLAADVLTATRVVEVEGFRPDTFDAFVLTRMVRGLAEHAGATGHQLFVALVDGQGGTRVYDMGRPGHDAGFRRVPPGHPPLAPMETWPDRLLLVTVMGESPHEATVRVENFENRVRQGWRANSPAMVLASPDGMTAGYAHMGVELTDLVGQPVESIEDGEPDGVAADGKPLFIDPNHREVVAIVRAAELAGETVTLSSAALPGLYLLRRADATAYELVGDAEMEAAVLEAANNGGAVVSAKLLERPAGSRYAAVRHVGHRIDGAEPSRPAVCRSVFQDGDAEPAISLTLADHGEILQEARLSLVHS